MKFDEYQEFATQGILQATREREPVVAFALGLVGETGEVVDDIKKRIFHGRDIPLEHTKEELGDVLWYLANIATVYGFSLEEIAKENVTKLKARYPQHYVAQKYKYEKVGPHIKQMDAHTGKFIRFISKEEYALITKDKAPWED